MLVVENSACRRILANSDPLYVYLSSAIIFSIKAVLVTCIIKYILNYITTVVDEKKQIDFIL